MKHRSLSALAKALDVSRQTLHNWRQWEGFPEKTAEGWDEKAIRAWYPKAIQARRAKKKKSAARAATLSQTSTPPRDSSFDDFATDQRTTDEEKKWTAAYRKAKAMREMLELQRIRGDMVPKSEVEQMFATRVFEVTSRLDAMSRTLAPQLYGLSVVEIEQKIADHTRSIREYYARSLRIDAEPEKSRRGRSRA